MDLDFDDISEQIYDIEKDINTDTDNISEQPNKKRKRYIKQIKNGLVYEDNGVLHYKITSMVTSAKVNLGSSISNFYYEYSNAEVSSDIITIELPVPTFIKNTKITLESPTVKDILQAIHDYYVRILTKEELEHVFINKKNIKLYHLLHGKVFYAGLHKIGDNTYKLLLKK
jgi:hypothetical protein